MPAIDALLDTDVLVEILRGRPEAVAWLSSRPATTAGVPVIVWMELIQGARDHCLIAAIAVRLGVTLYTFNTGHFQVIPGLDVQSPYDRPQ